MKKVLMILLAFSLVFGLALTACGNSSGIADLAAEVEAMRKFQPEPPPPPPEFDKNVLKVIAIADWGVGVDLRPIYLIPGDIIEVKGKNGSTPQQILIKTGGDWGPLGGWNPSIDADAVFEKKFDALTAANFTTAATEAAGGKHGFFRICGNGGVADFYITDLTVTRGTEKVLDLSAKLAAMDKGEITDVQLKAISDLIQPAGEPEHVSFEIVGP